MVLTTDCSPGAGQFMPKVVWPFRCSFLTALPIGALEAGFWYSYFNLLLHAFACLAVNLCCLESKITGAGVSPASLISAPRGVLGSAPRMDLGCRFRRSWRSSRLPTSLRSHQSTLPYSATAWTQAIWTALTFSGTPLYVLVSVRSLASAALAVSLLRLWSSLNIRCASIQTPRQRVASLLNRIKPSPTLIFAVNFRWRCFLLPHLHMKSAASVFAVSKCSPLRPTHAVGFAAHSSSFVTTGLRLLPVATQPTSSLNESPSAETYSSTYLISPEVYIAMRIGDTGEL